MKVICIHVIQNVYFYLLLSHSVWNVLISDCSDCMGYKCSYMCIWILILHFVLGKFLVSIFSTEQCYISIYKHVFSMLLLFHCDPHVLLYFNDQLQYYIKVFYIFFLYLLIYKTAACAA